MAKFCPILNERVVYLICQECEDKVCQRRKAEGKTPDNQTNKKAGNKPA